MTEKKLHEKTIGEMLLSVEKGYEPGEYTQFIPFKGRKDGTIRVGDLKWSNEKFPDIVISYEDLRQWAVAIVKELNKKIKEPKTTEESYWYRICVRNFLIDRFELKEEDLE